jgi:CheY-like chemotaxis protein
MQCLEQAQLPTGHTLVVHSRPEEITAVLTALESRGHQVYMVCTPLEMVWMLENHAEDIHTAVISHHLGQADGLDVVAFLASRYPHVRRLLLAGEAGKPGSLPLGKVHGVLSPPFDLSHLKKVQPEGPTESGRKKKRAHHGPASS